MDRRNIRFAFVIAAFLIPSGADAQQTTSQPLPAASPQQADRAAGMRAACGPDVRQLCAGVQRGQGRIIQCLVSHQNDLSAGCKSVLQHAQAQRAARRAEHQGAVRGVPSAKTLTVPGSHPATNGSSNADE
jgi:hypothetical protein